VRADRRDPERLVVRARGKSGGWQKDLPENLVAKIEDTWPNLMTFSATNS